MNKIAQQDSPLLTTPISSDPGLTNIWNKYFADKHAKIVRLLRANIQNEPGLQAALTTAFPGFSWPEFADMPSNNTFIDVKGALDRIMAVPQAKAAAGMEHAVQLYMDQYNAMLKQLQEQAASKDSPKPKAKKPARPSPKIQELQRLLGVDQTGLWNPQTNTAFLGWLKTHGWDKYISGNRFTGNINDAITAILTENTPTAQAKPAGAGAATTQRQAKRLEQLKALGALTITERLERLKKL